MGKGNLAKQLQKCLQNLHSFTDGQVRMMDCDWEDLTQFTLEVSPNDGIYRGNRYKFKVIMNWVLELLKILNPFDISFSSLWSMLTKVNFFLQPTVLQILREETSFSF